MSKKPSLSAALNAASNKRVIVPLSEAPLQASEKPKAAEKKSQLSHGGKKAVMAYFDPAVSRQLKQMALNGDTTVQELVREALNDLFEKHNVKPIA